MNPRAWLVIAADGFEAVFIDQAAAMNYAARCHGRVYPLGVMHVQTEPEKSKPA